MFTEAEIRASLVFQLSKLCSLLIKVRGRAAAWAGSPCRWLCVIRGRRGGCYASAAGRHASLRLPHLRLPLATNHRHALQAANQCAGGSPWDVLMTGEAEGVLLRVPTLQPGCLDAAGGKVRGL